MNWEIYLVKGMLYSFQLMVLHRWHNGRRQGCNFREGISQISNLMFSNLETLLPISPLSYVKIVYFLNYGSHTWKNL